VSSLPSASAEPVRRLVARTVEIDDPGELTALLPPDVSPLTWLRNGDGFVGWGVAHALRVTGPDRFDQADAWWRGERERAVIRGGDGLPGGGLIAFGSFAFADDDVSILTVPSVLVGRVGNRAWLTTVGDQDTLPARQQLEAYPTPSAPRDLVFSDGTRSGPSWMRSVANAVARVNDGELEKVVLARDVRARAADPVDLRYPLARLADQYPSCWTYAVGGLIGATPEMLVRLRDGLITSRVLAGTIRRTGDDDRDLALAASLARSSKDLEEHEYAVRSVADALAPYCTGMNVPESPFVLHLPNVMHLATDVTGVLARSGATALLLAGALHPSAAVCGTPTAAARALITEIEGLDRGRYAGPVGWIGTDGDGEWGLALRCAQQSAVDPRELRLYAGCGVVGGSDPTAELAESQAKTVPLRSALATD
jgi:menaquinone-specific isochorismate synthase